MRRRLSFLLMLAAITPAAAADATYTYPLNPSFTLLIPDGWKAEKAGTAVVISHGKSYFYLAIMSAASPGALLTQIRPQLEKQHQQFHEMESGQTRFGGQPAAFGVYSGVPPSGVPSIERVVAMTTGTLSYVAFEEASLAEVSTALLALARIERSFTPSSSR